MNTQAPLFRLLIVLCAATFSLTLYLPTLASADVALAWVQQTRGVSVALDADDNVYTVDYEQALGAKMTLTKRGVNGELLWVTSYDQSDQTKWERASWVATDSAGNAIVCGTLMSGYSNPVEAASIVMKFDPSGNLLWRHVYESNFDGSSVRKCLVDADDNTYVLGMGNGPTGRVTKVKKFASDGTPLWSYFDTVGIGAALNFKLTPDNAILISGQSITGSLMGYAKIDLNGQPIWSYPGVYSLTVGDSAGDANGNSYLVHGEYVANGGTVIKKLNASGTLIWQQVYQLSGFRVEVGSDNHVVVSGLPNTGSGGAAFIKVDGDSNLIWSNLDADGPLALLAHAHMRLDRENNAYLAAGTMSAMAVCKVNSDGTSGWTQTIPFGYAQAIALANTDDSVYVVGGTTARLSQGSVLSLPTAPSGLTYLLLTGNSADLSWTDNSSTETGFTLERCAGTLLFCGGNPGAWSVRTTLAANVTRFSDTSLAAGTTYSWRVKAFNAVGSSGYSNFLSATTPAIPVPAAPTNLRAQAKRVGTKAEVRLSWTDNATNETGYTIERCRGGTCTNLSAIASLSANAVQYIDSGLARATTYRYRVRAMGSGGNSPYSNIATVKTP